ncbi:MAG TPA: hydroxymethylbilane synthase [Candidatus Omnitrophica bacterium]|nr:MAG: hydroxymethylbilane synthase [Omnitrophica WOR_2 bacterium GWA2_63_20]OGX16106.1 MAG: hydroxymethylbilane synthase [Omnitrophica WOR_2 bacterium GWF2_63_9]OGX33392.1 MAG: hydroxymethylbilane synthase [Omnitrophica WOR_2 bacterium RIFCSPHIGHO2_12_FULL_64_13]OGX34817.1 MAG: hydroxymethylbilane synthase [Omnitrophica WOR_2 bacterium RIFCSPHIGHO2_02_FULL_63_39]OGX45902.1 MAG: hydroxymethylbilane synthase [Omnitrophica WOR_2 bacterium RIFCSPLOWO2_02_FULL_63_16]OGX48587.1 MAG: hydroxymethylb
MNHIVGARGSSLSRCQAQMILTRLEEQCPSRRFVFKAIASAGDRQPDVRLVALGEEGIFVKELEAALSGGEIDCAVHSLKDLPLATPEGLAIAAITERDDAHDAFISRSGRSFEELPAGSRIGTSSPRRISQLRRRRKDVECVEIRGNVDTRLRKLQEGQYDAIVLAACGLIRLGLEDRITELLPFEMMLPEPGQGCLAVEARSGDSRMIEMLRGLDHAPSRACVEAERALLAALGGGCRVPIAAHASRQEGGLTLEGTVVSADGREAVRDRISGVITEPVALGERLAKRLIEQGAPQLLEKALRP